MTDPSEVGEVATSPTQPRARRRKGPPEAWRNRIVGSGAEDPTQLLANPLNWRIHPGSQRDAMRGILAEVGWVQQVLVNQRTGFVVDGHLRVEEAISAGAESVPVLYVDLSPEEEALVLATLDPLGAMAGQSEERLRELLADMSVGSEGLQKMLDRMGRDNGTAYTGTISVPRYEPTGERPEVAALYDQTKAKKLQAAVMEDPELDEATRAFLLTAAARHIVFDYGQAAEFYAHAPANVQRHMEASALVIIDYEDAIRDGYVRFTDAIAALQEQDADADAT